MNMHVSLAARAAPASGVANQDRCLFLDEHGRPSHRHGLALAEPIDAVLGRLGRARGGWSLAFCHAAKASGIDLSVTVARDGETQLAMILPCDSQMALREPRYRALSDHVDAHPRRRERIIDLLNLLGRLLDNRPVASIAEAAHR